MRLILCSFSIIITILINGCPKEAEAHKIEINQPQPGAFIEVKCPGAEEIKIKYLGFVKNFDWGKDYHKVLDKNICEAQFGVDHQTIGFYDCKYQIRGQYSDTGNDFVLSGSITGRTTLISEILKSNATYIEIDTSPND